MSEPVLLFQAAGLRFGVALGDVSRLLVEDKLLPVPFSHPAMAGLVDADPDGPVPVFDLSGLVNPSSVVRRVPGATVALFATGKGPVGLRLDKLHGTAATYEAFATAPPVPTELLRTIGGAARAQGELFLFFSPEAFLAAIGL